MAEREAPEPDLHLTGQCCARCGEPLVREWLAYPFPPLGPAHASCARFAEVLAAAPERFAPVPTEVPHD